MVPAGLALATAALATASVWADAPADDSNAVYSEERAKVYFDYARMAFCSPEHLRNWDCGGMCEAARIVIGSSRVLGEHSPYKLQGYAAALPAPQFGEGRCIVAFRGSVNDLNWVADAQIWKTSYPLWESRGTCEGCKVHHGFQAAYAEVRTELHAAVAELQCRRTAVVGHSLGAALATLAAMDLRVDTDVTVSPVYLYGSPRVGNAIFAQAFQAAAHSTQGQPPAWRIIHYHDPVPRQPLAFIDYEHFPREVYYYTDASDAFKVCSGLTGEDESCAKSMPVFESNPSDHTKYLNLTTRTKELPEQCTGLSPRFKTLHRMAAAAKGFAGKVFHFFGSKMHIVPS